MNKLAFAVAVAVSALVNGAAFAQSTSDRDLALVRLADARDMSTGLAPNAGYVARELQPQPAASTAANARDRAIWRLTQERDQSTSLAK